MRLRVSFPGIQAWLLCRPRDGCAQYAPMESGIVNGAYFMKTWKRICRITFGLLLFAVFAAGAYAQTGGRVSNYQVSTFTDTWTDIESTGIPFTYNWFWDYRHDGHGAVPLPFDFVYEGTVVPAGTNIGVSINGYIDLLGDTNLAYITGYTDYPPVQHVPYQDSDIYLGDPLAPGIISLYSDYMVVLPNDPVGMDDDGNYSATDYYQVDGTPPNRVLTIEYHAIMPVAALEDPYQTGLWIGLPWDQERLTKMQIKLYEGSGEIDFIYHDHNQSWASGNSFDFASVGNGLLLEEGLHAGIGLNGFIHPSLNPPFVDNVYATNGLNTGHGYSLAPGTCGAFA